MTLLGFFETGSFEEAINRVKTKFLFTYITAMKVFPII